MKCNKLMWWAFGSNSWACKKLGICLCDPNPDPEYITVTICQTSEKLATACCRRAGTTVEQKFIKGEEPTAPCDFGWHQIIKQHICTTTQLLPNTPYCGNAGTVVERDLCQFERPERKCDFHVKPSPPVIPKIPDELTVPGLFKKHKYPITMEGWLIPSALIEKQKYFDQAFFVKNILNPCAERALINSCRPFSFGGWEPETLKRILYPFAKTAAGKFTLGKKDGEWLDQVRTRIKDNADRRIFTRIALTDNCSTHTGRPGFWNAHPWNGENNTNRTSSWKGSIYHFYEPEYQHTPGIPESAKWIEDFIRWIVGKLDKEFRPFIGWEINNEGQAGGDYHTLERKWITESGADAWRVFTSIEYVEFYKKAIWADAHYSIHGIQTAEEYQAKRDTLIPTYSAGTDLFNLARAKYPNHVKDGKIRIPFIPSEDGLVPIAPAKYRALVRNVLEDGALGFESNSRPYFYGRSLEKWLADPDTMKRLKAIGAGFHDFTG